MRNRRNYLLGIVSTDICRKEKIPMRLDRRNFLKSAAALCAGSSFAGPLANPAFAQPAASSGFSPQAGAWRNFAVVTRLEINSPEGMTQAWIPLPSSDGNGQDAAWIRAGTNTWTTNAANARIVSDPKNGVSMLHVAWTEAEPTSSIEVISKFSVRDRAIDLGAPPRSAKLSEAEYRLFTSPSRYKPLDGIVKATSDKATAGAKSELEKARAIYEWIIDNTIREASVRGCGNGDVVALLESGYPIRGKCADLNGLYVALARAAGLPARDVYGVRIAPSRFGYASLGTKSEVISKSQHCRAEVFIDGLGWLPVDPADVRKVMLEEPPANLPYNDPKVAAARNTLFGAWETNWLAYNTANDVELPGSKNPPLAFLMYPQAEKAGMRLDCLDPDAFKYVITSRELGA